MKDDSFIIKAVNSAKDSRKKSNEEIHLREIDIGLDFRKLLGEFTKKELQEIRRTWNFAGISQLNKAELIKAIAGRIEENLEKWLKLLNKEQFVNLKKVITNNEKKKYQYNLSEEIDFELLGYYRKRGVVFSGRYNNKIVLIIPEDLLSIIKKAIDKPDVYNQIKRNDEIIEITRGFLIYYGVLPLTDLYNKIEKLVNIEMSPYEFKQLIKEYNKYDYGLECTGDYLCLSEVIDLESIYIEQYRRSDLNYYSLSLKTVKKAAWLGHEPWNLIQRRFKRYLIQEYNFPPDEAEYLLDICVYQIKNDKGSMELLEIIQNYIVLPDMEEVRELLNLLTELQNNTRQWVIKGHTPNELFQEEKKHFKPLPEKNNEYARHEQGTIVRIKEKVGRNDPCPCGSGKKYKKCCGRN